jgi:hypothetical protein
VVLGAVAFRLSLTSGHLKAQMHTTGSLHVWYHLVLFLVLGALAWLSSDSGQVRLLLLVLAVLLGMGMEVGEAVRFHASIEGYDIRTDTLGVLLGGLAAWGLLQVLHRSRAERY